MQERQPNFQASKYTDVSVFSIPAPSAKFVYISRIFVISRLPEILLKAPKSDYFLAKMVNFLLNLFPIPSPNLRKPPLINFERKLFI